MTTRAGSAHEPSGIRTLPDNPHLDDFVAEARAETGSETGADADAARRTVAARYGFPDWSALVDRIWLIDRLSRWPSPAEPGPDLSAGITDPVRLANRLCRLGSLSWGALDTTGPPEARTLLDRQPWLAGTNAYTLALTGRHEALTDLLERDPEAARRSGGPHDWPPLLYLCYGRVTGGDGSATRTARVLLDAGADPDSGFLWHGRLSPFTALTGVFGGPPPQPPHPEAGSIAELLLERGADPNDHQGLLHRMALDDDTHLRLLLAFGLGRDRPSSWRERLGDHYPDGAAMAGDQLRYAASHGLPARVRLLLEHGIAPDGPGVHTRSDRVGGGRTPYRLAVLAGQQETAGMLAAAGADTEVVDEVDELTGRLGAGDGMGAALALENDPRLAELARARFPQAVALAAESGRLGGLVLLLATGFEATVPQPAGRTALHFAARAGSLAMVQTLLDHGARTDARDAAGASPSDWARAAGHPGLADQLDALAPPPTDAR